MQYSLAILAAAAGFLSSVGATPYTTPPNQSAQPPARNGQWGFRGETIIEIDTKTISITVEAFQGSQVSCSVQAKEYAYDTSLRVDCEIEGYAFDFNWASYNEPMFAWWTAPGAAPFKYNLQKYDCKKSTATEQGGCKFGFTNGPSGAVWQGDSQTTYLDKRTIGKTFSA